MDQEIDLNTQASNPTDQHVDRTWDGSCHDPVHHHLQVRDLHVHYGKICALHGVNLDIHCGQRVGIFGPNGAGKSTLLKSLAGLLPTSQGERLWNGQPVQRSSHEIAYLPQRDEVDWNFPITVRGVIEMGRYPQLGWFKRFSARDREAVDQAVETMRLEDLQRRQIRELSGGQQQRVFLARAIAQKAHVLLLDEPFTGLDAPSHELLAQLIAELASEGRLVIATHHGLQEAETLFDIILLLNRHVVGIGPAQEILSSAELRKKARLT